MLLNSGAQADPTLSVIILAGGQSRRMGQDKALLSMSEGQPLLLRTIHIAQRLAPDRVVVVTPWPELYQSFVPPQVQLIQEQQVELSEGASAGSFAGFSAGPLGGFAQGWRQVDSQWCLLLACDLPYLRSEPLQQWWAWLTSQNSLQSNGSSLSLASLVRSSVPLTKDEANKLYWEPLCGFYHRDCVPSLVHFLYGPEQASHLLSTQQISPVRSTQRSFQAWLKTLPIVAYPNLPPSLLFNCNTPDDWAVVQQDLG